MSRTKRNKAIKHKFFRDPKTKNTQTGETYAALEIEEAGLKASNRQTARANPKSGKVPSAFDDLSIAAYRESDYCKQKDLK